MLDAINVVQGGGTYYDSAVTQLLSRARLVVGGDRELTNREREVAQLVAQSRSNKQIAADLGVSVKTVDKHRTSLMAKLGLHDAVGVARYAISRGLTTLE